MPAEQDSPWKDIIQLYFKYFVAFFLPQAYHAIDWERKIEFLDKELSKIGPKSATRHRLADKLVKVYLKNGKEYWLLIHIEVQGYADPNFEKRSYIYNYRIFDRYDRDVVSVAILTDGNPNYRPAKYDFELWGFSRTMHLIAIKLLDFQDAWERLVEDPNPFAIVVMAQLKVLELKDKPELADWKFELVKMAHERDYTPEMVRDLLRFIDWLIYLPPELERKFEQVLSEYEEKKVMPYITSFERNGMERGLKQGLEQGLEQGERKAALSMTSRLLERRFGPLGRKLATQIKALSTQQIQELSLALLDFKDKSEVAIWLQTHITSELVTKE